MNRRYIIRYKLLLLRFILCGVIAPTVYADLAHSRICDMANSSTSKICGKSSSDSPPQIMAYAISSGTNTIGTFNLSLDTGALTKAYPDIYTSIDPQAVGTYNNDQNLYTVGFSDNTISSYVINQITGELSFLPNSKINTVYKPYTGTVSPSGNCVFADGMQNDELYVYKIESSGYLTKLPTYHTHQFGVQGSMQFSKDGKYFFETQQNSNSLITIGLNEDTCELESNIRVTNDVCLGSNRMVVTDDALYIACGLQNAIAIYKYNQNGDVSYKGIIDSAGKETYSVTSLHDKYIYVTNRSSNTVGIFEIQADATLKLKDTLYLRGIGPRKLLFDPTDTFVYVINQYSSTIEIYKLNSDNYSLFYESSILFGREPYSIAFKVLD